MSNQLLGRIAACASRAGAALTPAQSSAIARYIELLDRWNRTINLTAIPLAGFPDDSLDRLVGEPLVAASFTALSGRWIDLGSGGGSPAIPLKVLRPQLHLTMVESRERKGAFLREVVRDLGLTGAEVLTTRFEALKEEMPVRSADLVTVRGVRIDGELVDLLQRALRPEGEVFLFASERAAVQDLAGFSLVGETGLPSRDATLIRLRSH
ncbi:MAG: 16S rRNA (guanine(527)-N(7))-methyltransferase RsmG [Vicinamibacterales bacterium]